MGYQIINQDDESSKIDSQAVDGLLGVNNSLAYRVHEIEKHMHSPGYWFGISASQAGNDWAADTLNVFQAISGSGVYGADANDEAKVFGSDDTPFTATYKYFDLHYLLINDVSHDTAYKLRVVWGTGTMADAITAKQTSEVMVLFDSTNPQLSAGIPLPVQMPRIAVDTKVWIQCKNATDNATIDFFVGAHEYAG